MAEETKVPRELFDLLVQASAMADKRRREREETQAERERLAAEKDRKERAFIRQVVFSILESRTGSAAAAEALVETMHYHCEPWAFSNGGNYVYVSPPEAADIAINVYIDFDGKGYQTYDNQGTFIVCDEVQIQDNSALAGSRPFAAWRFGAYSVRTNDFLSAYSYAVENWPIADEALQEYEEQQRQYEEHMAMLETEAERDETERHLTEQRRMTAGDGW